MNEEDKKKRGLLCFLVVFDFVRLFLLGRRRYCVSITSKRSLKQNGGLLGKELRLLAQAFYRRAIGSNRRLLQLQLLRVDWFVSGQAQAFYQWPGATGDIHAFYRFSSA